MKTRRSEDRAFIEVHLCVDGEVTVREAHELNEGIEEALEPAVPGMLSTIHIEDQTHCESHKSHLAR